MRLTSLTAAACLVLLWSSAAHTLDLDKLDLKSKYEQVLVRWALDRTGLKRDPAPEGKIIERIVIVREQIIAESDPWPNFINWFHVTTREYVVRQELLVKEGEVWDEARVAESARNLREMFILATAQAVPCRSPRPGRVVLLVVTKDLWSIRMNTLFNQVGSVLQRLDWTPTEQNFLGRNKRVSLHLRLQQFVWDDFVVRDHVALGQLYVDRRVWGTRLKLTEWVDFLLAGAVPCGGAIGGQQDVWCQDTAEGKLEGAYVQLRLQRPLFSLDTRWGFDSWFVADVHQFRRYRYNSAGTRVRRGERGGLSLRTDQLPSFPGSPAIPRVYDVRRFAASAEVTRSFGDEAKHDVSWGLTGYSYRYDHPGGFPFSAEALATHRRTYLPRSEDALYAFAAYRSYSPRYVRLRNIRGFALTEDYRLGHDLRAELRTAANLASVDQSFVTVIAEAEYAWYVGGDLLRVSGSARSRMQPNLDRMGLRPLGYDSVWVNTIYTVALHNVSPLLWFGRLHVRAALKLREHDLDRQREFLGGGSGLRGYVAEQFEGDNLLQLNLEYRSRPINLLTLHLGFVVFYDAGGVFGGPDPATPSQELPFAYKHSVGLGLRGHFPQFDKESLRVDFAVPLTSDRGSLGTWISFSFGQVF